ncbi:MAG TPA: hypothetical protein DGR79_04650 [Clostridiales bacterium]|nr:hypothetical protein [Clostridiales bacterium]
MAALKAWATPNTARSGVRAARQDTASVSVTARKRTPAATVAAEASQNHILNSPVCANAACRTVEGNGANGETSFAWLWPSLSRTALKGPAVGKPSTNLARACVSAGVGPATRHPMSSRTTRL